MTRRNDIKMNIFFMLGKMASSARLVFIGLVLALAVYLRFHPPANELLRGAAARGDLDACLDALGRGADVHQAHHGLTPLHLAARGGHTFVVLTLLDRGADAASTTPDGRTAADLATNHFWTHYILEMHARCQAGNASKCPYV